MPFNLLKQVAWILTNKMSSWVTSPRVTYYLGEPLFWVMGMRRKGRRFELTGIKKVLVVRLDGIGDVVLSTPFLRELRKNLPGALITLVVNPSVYNMVELCPYVNEVLTFDWNIQSRFLKERLHGRALKLAWEHHLWSRRFDMAVVPRWDADTCHASFVAFLSGAPWRVGYSEKVIEHKKQLNRGYDRLFSRVIDGNQTILHEVERSLDLLRFLGGRVKEERLELWISEEDKAFAEDILKSAGVRAGDLIVAFAPGAGAPKRKWPLSHFIELGSWLIKEYNARIILIGGLGEEPLGQEIKQQLGDKVIDLSGKTTLRQAGALIKHCSLFIGNDSGTIHLAAAGDIPLIEISCHPKLGSPSHANSPLRFGPWRVPSTVLQPDMARAPCSDSCTALMAHCIEGVKVEQVKEAVKAQLRVSS